MLTILFAVDLRHPYIYIYIFHPQLTKRFIPAFPNYSRNVIGVFKLHWNNECCELFVSNKKWAILNTFKLNIIFLWFVLHFSLVKSQVFGYVYNKIIINNDYYNNFSNFIINRGMPDEIACMVVFRFNTVIYVFLL